MKLPPEQYHDLDVAVRRLQPEIESSRRLPDELVKGFRDAGLFRLGTPASLGGGEAPVAEMVRSIGEISRADGSARFGVARRRPAEKVTTWNGWARA